MKVKLARVEKKLTQEELCKKVGIAKSTLIKVERGDFSPLTYVKIVNLSNVLGKTAQDLFFEEEE